jgi:hypothetical protein
MIDQSPAIGPVPSSDTDTAIAAMSRDRARVVFDAAVARYIAERRERIPGFVDRHFGFKGALRLHRRAVGWDIARAPCNLLMAVPTAAVKLAAAGSRRAGAAEAADWLERRNLFLTTDVAREIEWLLHTELLELPYAQPGRESHRDALAEAMFADPQVDQALRGTLAAIARHADDPVFRDRLAEALAVYTGTRTAAAEIATGLVGISVGALAFQQVTPGMMSLGPAVAAVIAQHAAIAGFPLGAGLGGLWYGLFPAAAAPALVAGVTGGLAVLGATLAAFAGVLTDPVQARFGLHQRRLMRLLDTLETSLRGDGPARFLVRDHYVARLLDLFDYLGAAYRLAR